ncbi:phosphoglycolate phosphatase [Aliiroseovarius sediminilitoris]|uniref:phosphoglycolate phosphatase n=1 Tax=Aliiroseovarius sediminilitoris TaxID=1173584 RepID=A0A1I0NLD3_9RHOB|nr:phosphoglycolate phosphatase [Aliiroseovarius sediminilitoris]SEW02249.1 phosphoglycolate phosphatase [Aliiroseovarius sediminilitoris]
MTIPEAIIFDLDGTLVHSAPDLQAATNVVLAALDRAPLDLQTIISFIGDGVEKLVERSLKATGEFNDSLQAEALTLFLENYEQNMTTLTRPYPGVVECLEQLCASDVPLGVCTNKPTEPARRICAELGLTRYFNVIVGAEPNVAKKPDPAPLHGCISGLGTTPDKSVYVGDSAIDFQTARNAAVPFRLFSGGYLNGKILDVPTENCFRDWTEADFLNR